MLHRILAIGIIMNVILGLWDVSAVEGADPFKLTVAPIGPNNPRNSEAAIVPLKKPRLKIAKSAYDAAPSDAAQDDSHPAAAASAPLPPTSPAVASDRTHSPAPRNAHNRPHAAS